MRLSVGRKNHGNNNSNNSTNRNSNAGCWKFNASGKRRRLSNAWNGRRRDGTLSYSIE